MLQERAVAGATGLKFGDGALAARIAGLVFLCLVAGGRIEAAKVFDRDGWFIWVWASEGLIEINEVWLFVVEFGDEVAHLKPPIAEMGVRGHIVAKEAQEALQRVSDDGRAQMADVHRLSDIGAAKVDERHLRIWRRRSAAFVVLKNVCRQRRQRRIGRADVDKAGSGDNG